MLLTSDVYQELVYGLKRSLQLIINTAQVKLFISRYGVIKLEIITIVDQVNTRVFDNKVQALFSKRLSPCDVEIRVIRGTIKNESLSLIGYNSASNNYFACLIKISIIRTLFTLIWSFFKSLLLVVVDVISLVVVCSIVEVVDITVDVNSSVLVEIKVDVLLDSLVSVVIMFVVEEEINVVLIIIPDEVTETPEVRPEVEMTLVEENDVVDASCVTVVDGGAVDVTDVSIVVDSTRVVDWDETVEIMIVELDIGEDE